MFTVANALMALIFSPVYLVFWGVILAPAAYGLIVRLVRP